MGLATAEEVAANRYDGTPYTADFAFAGERRLALLEQAFLRIDDTLAAKIKAFEVENPWLTDYSVFMAVKEAEGGKPWWQWSDRHAHYHTCIQDIFFYESRAAFWKFVQYIFYQQWGNIKAYANEKGVAVLGDMPIYVAMDSADVWSGLPLFLIDEKTLKPEKVAGVPPDYFSENGQLWGNPLYDWAAMEKDGYGWWLSRLGHALTTYDAVRIDHFRAFASYWAVDAQAKTAKVGQWLPGPGMKLFDKVFEVYPNAPIIAEDLGVFGEDVVQLLADTGFPGMKVVQFGFDPNGDSSHMPHNAEKNSINYVGTHDNNTLTGWFAEELTAAQRKQVVDYFALTKQEGTLRGMLRGVLASTAALAIIPMADWLEETAAARMNTPGQAQGNWQWRADAKKLTPALAAEIRVLTERYFRAAK